MEKQENQNENTLLKIMQTAKTNPEQAESDILDFVQNTFAQINAISVKINKESKVSLNSVNGIIQTQGDQRYFFKFHAEEGDKTTINEYYQSKTLEEAGLPIRKPIYASTQPGKQFLIYEEASPLTAFDEFHNLEEKPDEKKEAELIQAEERLLTAEAQVFLNTLETSTAADVADAPLYQLFHTRLVSKKNEPPRLDIYYTGQETDLPNGEKINFDDLAQKKWIINGVDYSESLLDIINTAKDILAPLKNEQISTVLGHGDDHNANKSLMNGEFILFDPAFAGRQPALLSFIKATAHNTFLHPFWLYHPEKLEQKGLDFSYEITDDAITINHNWDMEKQSPMRKKMLDLQVQKVWQSLIAKIEAQGNLPENYKEYIRKALFCCPFLVYNLIDRNKYSSTASLLALSKCVELGSKSDKGNYVDEFLEKL